MTFAGVVVFCDAKTGKINKDVIFCTEPPTDMPLAAVDINR